MISKRWPYGSSKESPRPGRPRLGFQGRQLGIVGRIAPIPPGAPRPDQFSVEGARVRPGAACGPTPSGPAVGVVEVLGYVQPRPPRRAQVGLVVAR